MGFLRSARGGAYAAPELINGQIDLLHNLFELQGFGFEVRDESCMLGLKPRGHLLVLDTKGCCEICKLGLGPCNQLLQFSHAFRLFICPRFLMIPGERAREVVSETTLAAGPPLRA